MNLFRWLNDRRAVRVLENARKEGRKWDSRTVSVEEGEALIAQGWTYGGYGIGDSMNVYRRKERAR